MRNAIRDRKRLYQYWLSDAQVILDIVKQLLIRAYEEFEHLTCPDVLAIHAAAGGVSQPVQTGLG